MAVLSTRLEKRKPPEGGWSTVAGMKLPEWRPIPRHIVEDDSDTQVAFGVFGLLAAGVLVVLGIVLFLAALLA